MSCATLETIAGYVLDELPAGDASSFEEHLFACAACARSAERMQRLVSQLASALPPVLTQARRQALAVSGAALPAVDVAPGQRARLRLGGAAPRGLWVMHAPLAAATRVDLEARTPGGDVVFALHDVPFDARRGEVLLACQVHYQALPGGPELHVRLTAAGADGERPVGEYILDHEFESL